MCTPCVHHEEPMPLDVISNPNSISRLFPILPDCSRLYHMTSRSRTLHPLQTNNYYCSISVLTLTLPKVCPYSRLITQQFLYCDTPGFISMSRIVTIQLLMLKHLLMRPLALELLYISYISTQITAMSNLEKALIMHGQEARTISLKIQVTFSTILVVIGKFISSIR